MTPLHTLMALLVALIWGFNFVAIKVGLGFMPPLLFSALRFALAATPFLLIYRRPGLAWKWILGIGLVLGVVKFALLFTGMDRGMPAGLSAVVLQTQAFFTMLFAAIALGEKPSRRQIGGLMLAFVGVVVIAGGLSGVTLEGFMMILAAAAFWGIANILTRRAAPRDPLRMMVWVCVVPPLPLLALSWWTEGPDRIAAALTGMTWMGFATLSYVAFISTIVGFGVWSFLLKRYTAATVAPFGLLVPPFGIGFGMLLLDERPGAVKLAGASLILLGVAVSSWPLRKLARS